MSRTSFPFKRIEMPIAAINTSTSSSPSSRRFLRSNAQSKYETCQPLQDALPSAASKTSFFSLPIEIRNMIYRLVLCREHPVFITPMPQSPSIHITNSDTTVGIIYASKQSSNEALRIFYSCNTFEANNGCHPSATHTDNTDALKQFITQVPPHLLASISSMKLKFCLCMGWRPARMTSNPYNASLGAHNVVLGDYSHAAMIRHMCRYMINYLTGLKSLSIDWNGDSVHALKLLCRTATVSGLACSMRMLMKLPKLKQIRMNENIDDFRLVLDKIVADELVAGRHALCEELPLPQPEDNSLLFARREWKHLLSW